MEWEETVGANIRRIRKEDGLTQEQFAMVSDLDLRYLKGIELNSTVSDSGRLAEALDVYPTVFP